MFTDRPLSRQAKSGLNSAQVFILSGFNSRKKLCKTVDLKNLRVYRNTAAFFFYLSVFV